MSDKSDFTLFPPLVNLIRVPESQWASELGETHPATQPESPRTARSDQAHWGQRNCPALTTGR